MKFWPAYGGRRLSPVNGRREKGGKRPFRRGFFDTMAAEAVLKIREALPVRLHLILYELVQIGAAAFI